MSTRTIMPAAACRSIFSGHFYRMSSTEDADYLISTAAVQKLLIAAALGADANLADQIWWDLEVKHVDEQRLVEEAKKEGIWDMGYSLGVRARLEAELKEWLSTEQILQFFKNDFNELGEDKVKIENFFAADSEFNFKADYAQLAKNFFNVNLVKKNLKTERELLSTKFPFAEFNDKGLDIFGSVQFKLNFQAPIHKLLDGSFHGLGEFKYAEIENSSSLDFRTGVLELPLDGPLTMLIFMPNDFNTLLKQSIGRDYENFNEISKKLKKQLIYVKLPKIQCETNLNLRPFFAEHTYRGLREFFNEPVGLNRIFEGANEKKFEVGKFYQHTSLEINATEPAVQTISTTQPHIAFDATEKSILFVIKSERVLYVMGHFLKPEN